MSTGRYLSTFRWSVLPLSERRVVVVAAGALVMVVAALEVVVVAWRGRW